MKKFFALFAVAAMLFACEEPVPETTLALDNAANATLNLSTDAATKVVAFTTNAAWTAAADVEWITVTPASGVAGTAIELTIAVAENETFDARSGKVTITAAEKTAEVVVNQVQVDEVNVGDLTALTIGYEGGEVKLPVNHNIDFTVSVVEEEVTWAVVAEGTKAFATTEAIINVEKNGTGVARTCTLLVEADGFEHEVYLTQAGHIYSVNSTTVIPQVGTVTITDGSSAAAVVSTALYDGKLVVCAGDGTMPKLVNKATGAVEGELVTGGFVPYYVANDDAGNLVMTTRVHNNVWTGEYAFQIWYLTPGSTTATMLVAATCDNRHNGCGLAVRGDVTSNAAILVPEENPYYAGANAVAAWEVVNGVVGAVQNFKVTGFDGMKDNFGETGWWSGAPNNLNSFALLGTSVANGALMLATYPDNGVYTMAAPADVEGAMWAQCNLVASNLFDWDGIANATDLIYVDGVPYVAFIASAGFPHWGGLAKIHIYTQTAEGFALVANLSTTSYYSTEGPLTTSDVCLEAVEGGLNVHYICNSTTALEGFFIAL